MRLLEEWIVKHGKVFDGNILKVDSFLNHQIDVRLLEEIGKELHRLYADCGVNKILTIEASGIAIACMAAREFDCPLVFAKKNKTKNIAADVYKSCAYSFTHGKEYEIVVSKEFLHSGDRVLVVDDFLANGHALNALFDLVNSAGATLCGAGIAVEKGFQGGGDMLRKKGIRIESLAIIEKMDAESGNIEFR